MLGGRPTGCIEQKLNPQEAQALLEKIVVCSQPFQAHLLPRPQAHKVPGLQSAVPGPLAPATAGAQGPSKDGLVAAKLQSAVPGPLAPETAGAQGPSKDGLVAANLQSAVPGPLALKNHVCTRPQQGCPGFIAGSLATVPCPLASEALPHETKMRGHSAALLLATRSFHAHLPLRQPFQARLLQHVRRCRSLQQGLTPHQFQALLQRLLTSLPMPTNSYTSLNGSCRLEPSV